MRIGQEITIKEDFEINTIVSNKVITVKQGDKAIATGIGIKILNGQGRGKIIAYQEGEHIRGYDYANIANMILDRLNKVFELEEFLYYNEINNEDMICEIEDVLTDIL